MAAFHWTWRSLPHACGSCRRWTVRWSLSTDASRIVRANVQLVPDPTIPTDESGTRHRSAERTAVQTGFPVVSVSHSMSIVTVYMGGERHVLADSATILSRANQAIATLERYKSRLDEVSRQLSTAEIEDFVTLRDVMTVVQRLGWSAASAWKSITTQSNSGPMAASSDFSSKSCSGNEAARELIVRDYHANPEPPSKTQVGATLAELDALSDAELPRLHRALRVSATRPPLRAGLRVEFTRIPGDGGNTSAPVRPRRPVDPALRVAPGPVCRQRNRPAIGRRHRVDVGTTRPGRPVTARRIHDRGSTGLIPYHLPRALLGTLFAVAPAIGPSRGRGGNSA